MRTFSMALATVSNSKVANSKKSNFQIVYEEVKRYTKEDKIKLAN